MDSNPCHWQLYRILSHTLVRYLVLVQDKSIRENLGQSASVSLLSGSLNYQLVGRS